MVLVTVPAYGAVVYVDDDAAAGGNGQTWGTAFRFLTDALVYSNVPANGVTEIRIAQGIYRADQNAAAPAGTLNRAARFLVQTNAPLRGGYAGLGAPNPDARDIDAFSTTLTGDLLANDLPGGANRGDNSFHIILVENVSTTASLDGLFVRAGNALTDPTLPRAGAGLLIRAGQASLLNCTFEDHDAQFGGGVASQGLGATLIGCRFANSRATVEGGGLQTIENSLVLEGCVFQSNTCSSRGGGALIAPNTTPGQVQVIDCDFIQNVANEGGGLYCAGAVLVQGCSFSNNSAQNAGGCKWAGLPPGVSMSAASFNDCSFIQNHATVGSAGGLEVPALLSVRRCAFVENVSAWTGGGLAVINSPTGGPEDSGLIEDCIFDGNQSGWLGGGAHVVKFRVSRCTFTGNSSSNSGGGLNIVGREVVSCLFSGNSTATEGGGVYIESGASNPAVVRNCTFSANHANGPAGGLFIFGTNTQVRSTILWGNTSTSSTGMADQVVGNTTQSTFSHNCVQDLVPASAGYFSIDDDPMFVDPDGDDNIVGTSDDNLRLEAGTPCVDASQWPFSFTPNSLDLDGSPRVRYCRADIGAYESDFFTDCDGDRLPDVCQITQGGAADCNSNGLLDVCEPDCDANGIPDQCDLAGGAPDCNSNGRLDTCDIASGHSLDCDGNGVPDECQVDCNGNTVPDVCDIATGTSLDVNGNGIPDECEPDCNDNKTPDFIEIQNGTAQDCNDNAVIDACEVASGSQNDCNGNGLIDSCEIAQGLVDDCNNNGRPDQCDLLNAPVVLYMLDDGVPEAVLGNPAGGGMIWMNQFTVAPGGETINAVQITIGYVPIGEPFTVCIWNDPNNDGNPFDAQLLLAFSTNMWGPGLLFPSHIPIPSTFIGPVGTKFFVGAHIVHAAATPPAALDRTAPHQHRSWFVYGSNLGDLAANPMPPANIDTITSGDWQIRARSGSTIDENGDGVPDSCRPCPADIAPRVGNGQVNVADLLAVITAWGSCATPCPPRCDADIAPLPDGDCVVNVADLLLVITNWGDCP